MLRFPARKLGTLSAAPAWLEDFGLLREPSAHGSYAARLETFGAWLRSNGARFDALELRDGEAAGGSRGQGCAGFATADVPAHAPVVELPLRILVTSEAVRFSEIGRVGAASGVDDNGGNLYLTLALLQMWTEQQQHHHHHHHYHHKGGAGEPFHAPYLDILPRRLPSWPLFWDDVDLNRLMGSPLVASVEARREAIARDFDALREAAEASRRAVPAAERSLCALDSATAADFAVAELLVCSRAFLVPGAGAGGRADRCLVPLADMLNTALPHNCDVDFGMRDGEVASERVFAMTAVHPIRRGQQVHDSYGYKSNDR